MIGLFSFLVIKIKRFYYVRITKKTSYNYLDFLTRNEINIRLESPSMKLKKIGSHWGYPGIGVVLIGSSSDAKAYEEIQLTRQINSINEWSFKKTTK